MARKFLLVPEQQYRDLTSLSDTNNEILAGARGHMDRLMNDRKLNVSQKKALFNQQLKGFLRLRKDVAEKPVKVELAGGPKILLGRDGAAAYTDAEAEEPEPVEQTVPGANLLKPTTTVERPRTPPRRNRKRRNPVLESPVASSEDEENLVYRNRGTKRTDKLAQEDVLKEAYTKHFEKLAGIIAENRGDFGVDEHGRILNAKNEPILHSDFRDALAQILKKDVIGVTVGVGTPVGAGQLKKALKNHAATKELLNKEALLDAAESVAGQRGTPHRPFKFRPDLWSTRRF